MTTDSSHAGLDLQMEDQQALANERVPVQVSRIWA